jgi:hypothetical protein
MSQYHQIAYDSLGISQDGFCVGTFRVADNPKAIEAVSNHRIKLLQMAHSSALFPHDVIPNYHTYSDYLLLSKHESPGKYITFAYGHSVTAHDPTLSGYLAYIKENDSELSDFFLYELKAHIPAYTRNFHTYIVAKSRSGKTHFMKQLIYFDFHSENCSTIVIDPHGDMSRDILRWKENTALKDRIVYITPFLSSDHKNADSLTPVFNPLQVDESQYRLDVAVQELLYAFRGIIQTDWSANMEAVLKNCLAVLMRRKGSTLIDLTRFLDDETNEDLVELGAQSENRNTAHFFSSIFTSGKLTATKQAVYMKLQSLLSSETFYNLVIGKSTFDVRKLMNSRGKLVIFNLSQGALGSEVSTSFGRFILAVILASTRSREKIPEEYRVPCRIHIDECQNFVNESLETMLSEAGKYRISLTMAHQFLRQIRDNMILSSMVTNSVTKIVGESEVDVYAKMAKNMLVNTEDLMQLQRRQFYIRADSNKSFRFATSAFLAGDKYEMTPDQARALIDYQVKHYYTSTKNREIPDFQTRPKPQDNEPEFVPNL